MSALLSALGDLVDAYDESRIARANPAIEAISAIRQIDRTPFVAAALCRSIACDLIHRAGWSHTAEAEMAINALRDLADDLEAA